MKQFTWILLGALAISVFFNVQQCNQTKQPPSSFNDALEAAQDSIHTLTDNLNRQLAWTDIIYTEKTDLQGLHVLKDSTINKLLKITKEQKQKLQSASLIATKTSFDQSVQSEIQKTDTVIQYVTEYKDRWIEVSTKTDMDTDSTQISLSVKNEWSMWTTLEKKQLKVFVRNENPYTEIEELKSWEMALPPPRRWGFGVLAGYGIGANLKLSPYIGLGGYYRIF